MDITLQRTQYSLDGIFGVIDHIGVTLEHAFVGQEQRPIAVIPLGTYTCRRGLHTLHSHPEPFETFEVLVKGHTGVLFHWGNYNRDSDGCILLGLLRDGNMIVNSKLAFKKFMELQEGVDTFQLTVCNQEVG